MTPRHNKSHKRNSSKFTATKGKPDYVLLALTVIFLVLGLIMIFEASIYNADTYFDDRFYFVKQQAVWIILGSAGAAIFYFWDYHKFSKLAVPGMIVTFVLLIVVLVIGEEINGSKRWFYAGPIPVQPAELAKPVFILYLSTWLARDRKGFKNLKEAVRFHFVYELGSFLVLLGVIGGLIIFEPDLGTTVVICVVAFSIYFVSGSDFIHTLGSILIVIVGMLLGVLAATLENYRLNRIKTYLELLMTGEVAKPRGTGYQMQQIIIGIGSGGPWGIGFGQSRQRYGFLVENTAFTDSIFAIILEEMGMAGGVILIFLYVVFFTRAYRIAVNAPDKLGKLLAGGIGLWLVFQAFMHMGANLGLLPLTGVPLTFLTYGGSSTVVALVGVGMLLNISRYIETK
ncbi:cell division protein FtsW [Candidatus Dojkabacteria bacterium]|nr:cell division protein FtsW [Candidatus Dojkabacteria bacterium]